MLTSDRKLLLCTVILCVGDVLSQRFRFQKYRYDPWTGRTSSVEEFDEDIRNMDPKKLSKYMNELRRVKNGLEDMRRESEILERELGFGLGGFPRLMDNSENIIRHALDSVTDQLQRRIGHHVDPKLFEKQEKLEHKMDTADRPTLQRNLERLQQSKRELEEAKKRAQALKDELGLEDVPGAMQRAEKAIDHGMKVINHRLQKLDHPQTSQDNVNNTMKKVDDALRTADPGRLSQINNEFQKMRQYMDNVKAQLDTFHRDIGFTLDGVFEPFKMAKSILDHGLQSINQKLVASGSTQNPSYQTGGAQQGAQQSGGYQQGGYNQPNPAAGPQQGAYNQPHPTNAPQQGPYNQPHPTNAPQQGAYNQPNPTTGGSQHATGNH